MRLTFPDMALAKIIPTLLIILSVRILSFLIESKENNALDLNINKHTHFNVLSCERFDQENSKQLNESCVFVHSLSIDNRMSCFALSICFVSLTLQQIIAVSADCAFRRYLARLQLMGLFFF